MNNVVNIDEAKGKSPLPLTERSDDQLMLLARGGQMDAFDALIRRHQQMVVKIAMKYTCDPTAARDVSQSAFVDLMGAVESYEPKGKFTSFLGRITVNRCRLSSRKSRGELKALSRMAHEPKKKSDLADEHLLRTEKRKHVERALQKLSPKLREVLVLRFVADMSYRDIADTLDIRLGTVKSRIFAGLAKLNNTLGGV